MHTHLTRVALALPSILLLANAATALAQGVQHAVPAKDDTEASDQEHPPEPQWFLEPTYVAFVVNSNARPVDARGHAIEVHSMAHLPMFPRQNSTRFDDWIQRSQSRNRFTLTLGTTIRGHKGASVPIQTPSVYFAGRWQRLVHRRTPTSSKIWMFGAGVGHHSNGQDGCTFGGYSRIDKECRPDGTSAARTLNTADGSFGVNYLEARGAVSSRIIRDVVEVDTALTLGLDYRFHVPWIPGGGGLTDIDHLYGRHELRASFQQEWPTLKLWRFDHLQLALRGWTRFGAGSEAATGGSADLAYFGFAGGMAGPFVRLYGGNDYYNIRFQEKRRYVMLGIVWDHSRLARFPKRSADQ